MHRRHKLNYFKKLCFQFYHCIPRANQKFWNKCKSKIQFNIIQKPHHSRKDKPESQPWFKTKTCKSMFSEHWKQGSQLIKNHNIKSLALYFDFRSYENIEVWIPFPNTIKTDKYWSFHIGALKILEDCVCKAARLDFSITEANHSKESPSIQVIRGT